jgi:hypothetical protein
MHADFVGCPAEFAVKTWNLAESRGGRDSKDVPIRSFRHHLATAWAYEQERNAKKEILEEKAKADPSTWELKTALDVKVERLKDLRNQHAFEQPGGGFKWDNPQNLAAARNLKEEIAALKAKIEASVE